MTGDGPNDERVIITSTSLRHVILSRTLYSLLISFYSNDTRVRYCKNKA